MARKLTKRSVKKHSFFKVLVGDFSSQLCIPPAFIKNFNGRSLHKCALRGPSGRLWNVTLEERENGLFFCEGWQGFVKDHLLQGGDFLIFRYNGESKFKVKIYDRSACEKNVEVGLKSSRPVLLVNKRNPPQVKEEIVELDTEDYNNYEDEAVNSNRRNSNVMSGNKPRTDYAKEPSTECIMFKSENPCFIETLKKHKRYCLTIPKKIAKDEGLTSRKDVILRDQAGRSWLVRLIVRPKSSQRRVDMSTGWGECCKENQISDGDTVVFEIVKQRLIQIHIFRAVRGKRCSVVLDCPNIKSELVDS